MTSILRWLEASINAGAVHYVDRRTAQGLSKKEILCCPKRYVVRDVHTALLADFEDLAAIA